MKLRLFVVFSLLLVWTGRARADVSCQLAVNAMEIAAQLRDLAVLHAVPCKIKHRAEVEQYLRETIDQKIPKGRIENEEQVYKLLGLIPEDYSYIEGVLKLYTEQVGGYYDPDKDYYGMAAWIPEAMQMTIAVHELTHALQDQHFKLDKLMEAGRLTSDELMSRSALAEGDATIVMLDYVRTMQGLSPVVELDSVGSLMMQNIGGAMFSSSLQSAPPALQALMLFPYISGLNLAHFLMRHGGHDRLDQAFHRPPISSKEVLHPEIYLKRLAGTDKMLPAEHRSESGDDKALFTDTMGEFVINVLLSSRVPRDAASRASAGWEGDRLLFFGRNTQGVKLSWRVIWESPADADEFFQAFRSALISRFSGEPSSLEGDMFTVRAQSQTFILKKTDRAVRLEVE